MVLIVLTVMMMMMMMMIGNDSGDHDADDEKEFVQKLSAGAGSSSFGKNALGISSNSIHF